jgi:F-type H+-transporting ATPase subunit delta
MASVAAVYAKALFEIAEEKGLTDRILAELTDFSASSETVPALQAVVSGMGMDPVARRAVLKNLAVASDLSPLTTKFLDVLVLKNRAILLPELTKEFSILVENSRGVITGELKSAVELSSDEIAVLSAALGKKVGAKVKLEPSIDPSLLGGVVAVVGGKTFDASLRTQLERFRNELI